MARPVQLSMAVDTRTYRYFSGISAIESDVGAFTAERGSGLSTPSSFSGSVSGGNPSLSWSSVSGASEYHIYREIHKATGQCTDSNDYIGSDTGSPFLDDEVDVNQYYGTNQPGPQIPCYVQYRIYAAGGLEVSDFTAWIYFSMD